MEALNTFPIEHFSYSSLTLLCSNEQQFKKNYILHMWDFLQSPSAITGKAVHKAMEMYKKGLDWAAAIQEGQKHIESIPDKDVQWGKTGSREKVIKEYYRAIELYRAEEPELGKTIDAEVSIVADFEFFSGIKSPVPLKVIIDLVTELDGELRGWDYKVVSEFTNKEDEQPDYIIQSLFAYYGALAKYKRKLKTFTFIEIKKSKNKDGSKQIEFYEIVFEKMQHYFNLFEKLYTGAILTLANPNHVFLPNFSHPYSGKEAWQDFVAETFDMEMPKQIVHKTSLVQFVDKPIDYKESDVYLPNNSELQDHEKIISKLLEFGIPLSYESSFKAPNVTLHTFKPSRGVKMSSLNQYESDIALALGTKSVRIAAPILGTQLVGVEIGNSVQQTVVIPTDYIANNSLDIPVGVDVYGKPYFINLSKAPHLLVAGTTGSGKSVFLNIVIKSLMKQNSSVDLNFLLIDPKQTEFNDYEGSDYLLADIITELEDAQESLVWAVDEMNRRYKLFKESKVKNIDEYSAKMPLSKIVIVIDELNDLIMGDKLRVIESLIVRLAQKARAAGIHIVAATQRPSVDVVTGVMKANFPTRIAFRVATGVDSKVIIDQQGAEQLLGNGDLLLKTQTEKDLIRLQGYYL